MDRGASASGNSALYDGLNPWLQSSGLSLPYTYMPSHWVITASDALISGPLLPTPPPPLPPPPPPPQAYAMPALSHPAVFITIPQSNTGATASRKHSRVPPIEFWIGGRQGIRLIDALQGNVAELVDFDDEVMHATSAKVSYRVEWLGYKPLSRQKYARRVRGLQNRGKIAKQVAEVVSEFVNDRARQTTSQPEWRIGRSSIEYENLYLMEIHRVSQSTWVPVLAYAA